MMRGDGPMNFAIAPAAVMAGGALRRAPGAIARAWRLSALAAVLISGTVAWASLPRARGGFTAMSERQWRALGVAAACRGRPDRAFEWSRRGRVRTGRVRAASARRPLPSPRTGAAAGERPKPRGPMRISGPGWRRALLVAALGRRSTPDVAAQYLAALASEIDVGADIHAGRPLRPRPVRRRARRACFTPGSTAALAATCKLVRWGDGGASSWIDAAHANSARSRWRARADPSRRRAGSPHISATGSTRSCASPASMPESTSAPAGAARSSPPRDGQVVGAGWAGGYGRQVRIAHGGGHGLELQPHERLAVAPGHLRPPRGR